MKAAVIERHGKTSNIGLGFVQGFGIKSGALATTVSHDSHNICVVGTSDEDIAAAVNALNILQGGSVVIRDGKTMASLPLSVAGLLTDRTYNEFNADLQKLMTAAAQIGCTLPEPFYQLSFLALPVIPHLKLRDKGLFDVDVFQHIRQN